MPPAPPARSGPGLRLPGVCFLAGLIYPLGMAIPGGGRFGPATWIACGLFLWLLGLFRARSPWPTTLRQRLLAAASFSLGLYLTGITWVPHAIQHFGGLAPGLAHLLGLIYGLLASPQFYLLVLLDAWLWRRLPGRLRDNRWWTALALTLTELAAPQIFPFAPGHVWLGTLPRLALGPIIGATGYTVITWAALLSLTDRPRQRRPALALVGLLLLASALGPDPARTTGPTHPSGASDPTHTASPNDPASPTEPNASNPTGDLAETAPAPLAVRLVQPDLPSYRALRRERGRADAHAHIYQRLQTLSLAPSSEPGFQPELIIWPEGAAPVGIGSHDRGEMARALPDAMTAVRGAELIYGATDRGPRGDAGRAPQWNALVRLDRDSVPREIYQKRVLVPFGERLPLGPLNPLVAALGWGEGTLQSGPDFVPLTLGSGLRATPLICYEVVFSDFVRRASQADRTSQLLINITNDSWYGDSVEPHQHLFVSRWRALELGQPLLRAATDGISTVVWPDGSLGPQLAHGTQGVVDVWVPPGDGRPTLYARLGALSWLGLALIAGWIEWVVAKLSARTRPQSGPAAAGPRSG